MTANVGADDGCMGYMWHSFGRVVDQCTMAANALAFEAGDRSSRAWLRWDLDQLWRSERQAKKRSRRQLRPATASIDELIQADQDLHRKADDERARREIKSKSVAERARREAQREQDLAEAAARRIQRQFRHYHKRCCMLFLCERLLGDHVGDEATHPAQAPTVACGSAPAPASIQPGGAPSSAGIVVSNVQAGPPPAPGTLSASFQRGQRARWSRMQQDVADIDAAHQQVEEALQQIPDGAFSSQATLDAELGLQHPPAAGGSLAPTAKALRCNHAGERVHSGHALVATNESPSSSRVAAHRATPSPRPDSPVVRELFQGEGEGDITYDSQDQYDPHAEAAEEDLSDGSFIASDDEVNDLSSQSQDSQLYVLCAWASRPHRRSHSRRQSRRSVDLGGGSDAIPLPRDHPCWCWS